MHFVARRAELRRLLCVKALQKGLLVRLRVELEKLVVRPLQPGILADGEVVQRRVFDSEIGLPHRALDVNDGMAGRAAQAVLRFGRVDLLFDGAIKAAIEKDRVIVTAGAPLGRLRADDILHVLDGLAIPLIVERGEVMCRRVPLIVNLFVTSATIFARHEKRRRDGAADVGFGARRKEGLLRPRAFLFHHERHQAGIDDLITIRARITIVSRRRKGEDKNERGNGDIDDGARPRRRSAADVAQQHGEQQHGTCGGERDVRQQRPVVLMCRANLGDVSAEDRAGKQQYAGDAQRPRKRLEAFDGESGKDNGQRAAEQDMQRDVAEIE